MLVDLGLPDGDGLKLIRHIRSWSPLPIVVLSARVMESQKIAALDAGADDYVTKPFSAAELMARVRAGLRRNSRGTDQLPLLQFGAVQVNLERRTVTTADAGDLRLTPLEYRVLDCLARNAGLIVTAQQLMREVWGPVRSEDTASLRSCIRNLRSKLEPDARRPGFLLTEPGLGYRLKLD
jgi:two-component system KDP operon response regulator KdpE